jgi:hypothetical protein
LLDAGLSQAVVPTIERGRVEAEELAQQRPRERKSMTTSAMGISARTMRPGATNTLFFETENGFTLAHAAPSGGTPVSRSVRPVQIW